MTAPRTKVLRPLDFIEKACFVRALGACAMRKASQSLCIDVQHAFRLKLHLARMAGAKDGSAAVGRAAVVAEQQ